MNNKAFTLIEVLGAIIILTIITFLITPNIVNKFRTKKDDIDKTNREIIISAAKLYINDNGIDSINSNCLSIATLKNEGYLNPKIVNIISNNNNLENYQVKIPISADDNYEIVQSNMCN